jgi:hypothetical protein
MKITSTAFADNGGIPTVHTCEGRDVAPPLQFDGVPAGAKSLALIVDDPDAPDPAAPKMTWVHWVVYDIAPATAGLPETARSQALSPEGRADALADLVADLVGRAAGETGLVLAIDDTHWMDSASWRLLERVCTRTSGLLVVLGEHRLFLGHR